ncbi:MAG: terminase gpA endonuclease subunit, partial [Candidatus Rokuibacteriota bacterium]
GKPRAKDGTTNSITAKSFRGGSVVLAGANSASSLASRSVRLLILDETDRYPPELPGEGNTLEVAIKRTLAYLGRRRVLMLSSPTLRGAPIHAWYQRGDQRKFFVPCPTCGAMHTLEWANVRFDHHDAATARMACPACGAEFGDAERVAILSRGEWRPTATGEPGIRSFHLWEAYSPLSSLSEIVAGFLRAREAQKAGDRSVMHSWTNTTLGEPVDPDDGEGVEPHVLLLRRESYGPDVDAPARVLAATMGVDCQDDRLELLVVGWGLGEEAWLLDRGLIPGDTSRPEPWQGLLEVLDRAEYRGPAAALRIGATCIDSAGHRTAEVYDFVHQYQARRIFATIGRDGQRPLVSSPSPQRWGRELRRVRLHTVGVDAAKALVASRLMLTETGPGYVHIPHADWADEELALQLTAERLVTRFTRGVPETVWKKTRPRNEMLDCLILSLAALRLWGVKLDRTMAPPPAAPLPSRPWLGEQRPWLERWR